MVAGLASVGVASHQWLPSSPRPRIRPQMKSRRGSSETRRILDMAMVLSVAELGAILGDRAAPLVGSRAGVADAILDASSRGRRQRGVLVSIWSARHRQRVEV